MGAMLARRLLPAVLAAGLMVSGTDAGVAQTEAPAEFYKGKSIAFIVASGAGGGYDLYARVIARAYSKYLPGNPSVVVQNMPGASGVRAMNFLYNVAPKDGLAIGLLQNFSSLAPFYKVQQAQFDATKYNWLGSPAQEYSVFIVWHDVPFKSIGEAKGQEVLLGSAGAAGTGPFYARVLANVFGLNLRLITGYDGLGGALLAMERGEIKGYPSVFWNTLKSTKAEWIEKGTIRMVFQWTKSPDTALKDVPYAGDLVSNSDDRAMLEIAAVPLNLGRPVAAPPGVPMDRVAALKSGLEATFKDAGYLADCAQQKLDCGAPVKGEALAEVIRKAHAAPEAVRNRLVELYHSGSKKVTK